MTSLNPSSPYLEHALPKVRSLLQGVLSLGKQDTNPANGQSSSISNIEEAMGTNAQAQLCEGLLRAALWIAWNKSDLRRPVAEILLDFLKQTAGFLKQDASMSESP